MTDNAMRSTPNMTKELVEVVQADKDLLADIIPWITDGHLAVAEGIIARHRLSAEAAIVAWLREIAPTFQPSMDSMAALAFAADAIEQGKHRHG